MAIAPYIVQGKEKFIVFDGVSCKSVQLLYIQMIQSPIKYFSQRDQSIQTIIHDKNRLL